MLKPDRVLTVLNKAFGLVDVRLFRRSALSEYLTHQERYLKPSFAHAPLPEEAARYLRPSNPRLRELRERYRALNHPATNHSLWTDQFVNSYRFNMQYFRGDNVYVWQYRKMASQAELKFLLHAYYIEKIDSMGLLEKSREDDLFGAYTFDHNGERLVSRDLLDSIGEIYFLERHLQISQRKGLRILDIGAGYGRLAHRMVEVLPNIAAYYCVDAVPESTFLSEFYLRFRGVADKAKAVPLYDLDDTLESSTIDIAVNIHSFSECTLSSITWWLETLRKNAVKYLMIVPHVADEFTSREKDGAHLDFLPMLKANGYQLTARDPIYLDSSLQEHISTSPVFHYLFELKS